MIELLVPAPVAAVSSARAIPVTGGEPLADQVEPSVVDPAGGLYPQEAATVARAVPRRQAEYAEVRACARQAMHRLGVPPLPILSGQDRAPIWPEGLVGSMTHCAGYRAAAVAMVSDVVTLGIDAEVHDHLPAGVLDYITSPGERAWVAELTADHPAVSWDRLVFSAKEAVFKAWYPLTGRWLGFEQAELRPGPPVGRGEVGTFLAKLLVPGPICPAGSAAGQEISEFNGLWMADDRHLVTAITVLAT